MPEAAALPPAAVITHLVADALHEDIGDGDLTAALIPADAVARATLLCREVAVLCGAAWFAEAFHQVDPGVQIGWRHHDGDDLSADSVVCEISGNARAILTAERTAINLLQTLSGTATVARRYAEAVAGAGSGARVRDTRKTIPGLRLAQKYAVAVGGACNHRLGLYDQILIKENHIAAAGSVTAAMQATSAAGGDIEIEVASLPQLREALAAGATRILLDNFAPADLREAVTITCAQDRPVELEASGNVDLKQVQRIAATGINTISIGALTKHLTAVDFSLQVETE